MRFLRAVRRFLISVWFLIPGVTLLLSICVWIFSPYIGTDAFRPFDEPFGRWIFITVLWVIALVTLPIIFLVRRFAARQIEKTSSGARNRPTAKTRWSRPRSANCATRCVGRLPG